MERGREHAEGRIRFSIILPAKLELARWVGTARDNRGITFLDHSLEGTKFVLLLLPRLYCVAGAPLSMGDPPIILDNVFNSALPKILRSEEAG